jgi:hypothetical protein
MRKEIIFAEKVFISIDFDDISTSSPPFNPILKRYDSMKTTPISMKNM